MSDLRAFLAGKLDDPDPVVRAHSRNRLAALEADSAGQAPAYPSLARQAVNFAGAVAAHVASGLAAVPEAERARRLAICRKCPSFEPCQARCRECGCYMEAKAGWESGDCPLGRWGARTGAGDGGKP